MKIIEKCSTLNECKNALEDSSIDMIQVNIDITKDEKIIFLDKGRIERILCEMNCDKKPSDFTYEDLKKMLLLEHRTSKDTTSSEDGIQLLKTIMDLNESDKMIILDIKNSNIFNSLTNYNNRVKISNICTCRMKKNVALLSENLPTTSFISHTYNLFGLQSYTDLTSKRGLLVMTSNTDALCLNVEQLDLNVPCRESKVYEFIERFERLLPVIDGVNTKDDLDFVKSRLGDREFCASGNTQLLLEENQKIR